MNSFPSGPSSVTPWNPRVVAVNLAIFGVHSVDMRDGIAKRAQRVADNRPAGFARNMGEIPFRELRDGRGSNRPIGGAESQ